MISESNSDTFTGKESSLFRTWRWIRPDFAGEFQKLTEEGADRMDSGNPVIWKTRHKYTLLIRTCTGRPVAFKRHHTLRLSRYLYYPTPTTREALNYHRLQQIGLPMAKLLAVGDVRHFFRPESSFLVTEFEENTLDGGVFCPGREMEHETAWRDEFCHQNFRMIAKLHDAGYKHRNFTPRNELWRKRESPGSSGNELEIIWIDVASCQRVPGILLRRAIPDDLAKFLHFFQFEPEKYREFLQTYCESATVKRFGPQKLFHEVRSRLEKYREKKNATVLARRKTKRAENGPEYPEENRKSKF